MAQDEVERRRNVILGNEGNIYPSPERARYRAILMSPLQGLGPGSHGSWGYADTPPQALSSRPVGTAEPLFLDRYRSSEATQTDSLRYRYPQEISL
jgi:hypothetical protein